MADDSIVLEGRKYVSSGRASQLYGYTKDYVGQLCRAGKLDAQLIGRSWYVSEDSIRKHKLGVHYTLKNPKKPRVQGRRTDEKTTENQMISDSRAIATEDDRQDMHFSAPTSRGAPMYAEIPPEEHSEVDVEVWSGDLFPAPKKSRNATLDPLVRSDIRYEPFVSESLLRSVESEDSPQTPLDTEAHDVPSDVVGGVKTVPIRSRSLLARERSTASLSGVRPKRHSRRNAGAILNHISDTPRPLVTSSASPRQSVSVDGVVIASATRQHSGRRAPRRDARLCIDAGDATLDAYGHRSFDQGTRSVRRGEHRQRSLAIPVLGALVVFAMFLLLYLLLS